MDKLRILIIDDSEGDRRLIRYMLADNQNMTTVVYEADTVQAGLDLYMSEPLDCILLDYLLPGKDGIEFVQSVKKITWQKEVPIIMMTGQGNEQVAVQAMKKGVKDYLVKGDLNTETLGRSIMYAINTLKLEQQLAKTKIIEEDIKLAEKDLQFKNLFMTNMSHELRTPLNAIIGLTEIIYNEDMGPINEEQKSSLNDVLSSARNLLRMICDVLDLSKMDTKQIYFSPKDICILSFINEFVATFNPELAKKNIKLSTEFDTNLANVFIDPDYFRRLIYSYLSNAIKFTPQGGLINISVKSESPEFFRIEIKDTGIGIKSDDIDKIFKPFQQVDTGTARKFQGAGLSLFFTKRIVEAQGGSVGVISLPEHGSVFYAVLPKKYVEYEKSFA